MKMEKYQLFEDPGHAWLQVTKKELTELNIADKITSYSYMDKKYAYLEEDLDLTTFLDAKFKFEEEKKNFCNCCMTAVYQERSKIRNFDNYQVTYNTTELQEKFKVISFLAPYVFVVRISDGKKGTLQFNHSPRIYYNFMETE